MMIHSKRLRLWLYLVLLAVFISACNVKEDKQIKENFNKTLSVNSGLKMLFYGGLKMSFFSGLRLSYI